MRSFLKEVFIGWLKFLIVYVVPMYILKLLVTDVIADAIRQAQVVR
jgi:hypothetical protein